MGSAELHGLRRWELCLLMGLSPVRPRRVSGSTPEPLPTFPVGPGGSRALGQETVRRVFLTLQAANSTRGFLLASTPWRNLLCDT